MTCKICQGSKVVRTSIYKDKFTYTDAPYPCPQCVGRFFGLKGTVTPKPQAPPPKRGLRLVSVNPIEKEPA